METQTFQLGDEIFCEGDAGTNAFIIKSGTVKITKLVNDDTPRTIATMKQGSIIGEMALIDDAPRAASAVALDEVEAMVITQEEFQKRVDQSDQVIALLLKIYTDRIRQQATQLAEYLR